MERVAGRELVERVNYQLSSVGRLKAAQWVVIQRYPILSWNLWDRDRRDTRWNFTRLYFFSLDIL